MYENNDIHTKIMPLEDMKDIAFERVNPFNNNNITIVGTTGKSIEPRLKIKSRIEK